MTASKRQHRSKPHLWLIRVVGIDASPRQVAAAHKLGEGLQVSACVKYVRADARRLPYPAGHFTHVYATESLIHVTFAFSLAQPFIVCQNSISDVSFPRRYLRFFVKIFLRQTSLRQDVI